MERIEAPGTGGLPYAIGAYLIWGLLPLYLMLVHAVPPVEFVGWRILFTVPVCLLAVAVTGQVRAVRSALANPKAVLMLFTSALLIGFNWLVYIVAVQSGHVFAASLGYYINPITNVLAGTLFLGERLTKPQWTAVAIAAVGVSLLAWGAMNMLWISLALASSFCGYGLVRKLAPVEPLPGLTIETALLFVPAAACVAWYAATPAGPSFGQALGPSLLIAPAGIITATPLLLFATAARRMSYSTLGFVQFVSPTCAFFLGLLVFHEALKPVQLACFVLIWLAIALFSWDLWQRRALIHAS
jgi:chloramphenicol-sensitive protein RarD